jgi:mannosyltransferase
MKLSSPPNAWSEYTLLAILTLLAAALRFYKLGEWSYFIDEMRTWDDALRAPSQSLWSFFSLNHHHAYSLITNLIFDTFGVSTFSLRVFPCMLGVLSIPLLYFTINRLFDRYTALIAVALIAISPWHIYMSQMARWYTLLLLVMFFALISFYIFIDRNELKYLLVYALLSFFAFTLHLTAFLIPMIAVVYLLLLLLIPRLRSNSIKIRNLFMILGFHGVLALATLPTFLNFLQQMSADQEVMGSFGRDFIIKALYHITPSIAVMALTGLVLLWRQESRKGVFLAVYLILPVMVLIGFLAVHMSVSARYLFFILPVITLAVGISISYVKSLPFKYCHLLAYSILMAAIFPSLQADYLYFTSEYGYRDRLNEAIHYMKNDFSSEDLLFVNTGFSPYDSRFYCTSVASLAGMKINADQLIASSWLDSIRQSKRVWVITIGRSPGHRDEFWQWIAQNTRLVAEFSARRATQDQTVKVYLHAL